MYRRLSPSSRENAQRLSNKGTEEPCNARSNKSRRGVQVVKEYLYSQCQDEFDLSNVPDRLMNITTSQNAST